MNFQSLKTKQFKPGFYKILEANYSTGTAIYKETISEQAGDRHSIHLEVLYSSGSTGPKEINRHLLQNKIIRITAVRELTQVLGPQSAFVVTTVDWEYIDKAKYEALTFENNNQRKPSASLPISSPVKTVSLKDLSGAAMWEAFNQVRNDDTFKSAFEDYPDPEDGNSL